MKVQYGTLTEMHKMPRIQLAAPRIAQSIKENTWEAIMVSQGVADMSFGSCRIVDETTEEHWTCRQGGSPGSPDCPFPVDIPYGHDLGAKFLCENSGEVPVLVRVYIAIIDPDGVTRADAYLPPLSHLPNEVNPGVGYYSEYIGGVTLDKIGLWLVYGRIEYEVA